MRHLFKLEQAENGFVLSLADPDVYEKTYILTNKAKVLKAIKEILETIQEEGKK